MGGASVHRLTDPRRSERASRSSSRQNITNLLRPSSPSVETSSLYLASERRSLDSNDAPLKTWLYPQRNALFYASAAIPDPSSKKGGSWRMRRARAP